MGKTQPSIPHAPSGPLHNELVPVWGVVNQKGGVGKTTTAVNLSAGLSARGQRVLLIDCDPQGNATTGVGIDKTTLNISLFDVLSDAVERSDGGSLLPDSIVHLADGFDCVPATLDLAGAEPIMLSAVGKEMLLRDALETVRLRYDWVILDAPPSLGLLTINVLAASDEVLVPMQCEFYALEGLSQLMKTIELVKRRVNPKLEIARVLLTMYDPRSRLTQQVTQEVQQFFGPKVSTVAIPRNIRLSEAPSFGEPAISLFPGSKGASAYSEFVDEVLGVCAAR